MGRTLTFELIADDRFGGTREGLDEMSQQVERLLKQLPTVLVDAGQAREIHWVECTQWRVRFWVMKGRATTWERIYETVNAVKVCRYEFLR